MADSNEATAKEKLKKEGLLDTSDALQYEVFRSDSSRFVETAHIHVSSKGNPEWFRAKDGCKRCQRVLCKK